MSLRRSQPLPLTLDHGTQDGWSSSWPRVAVSAQSLVYAAVETAVLSARAAGSKDGSVRQERQLTQKTKTSWNSPWGWTATNLRGCYSRGKPNLPSKVYPGPSVLFPQLWQSTSLSPSSSPLQGMGLTHSFLSSPDPIMTAVVSEIILHLRLGLGNQSIPQHRSPRTDSPGQWSPPHTHTSPVFPSFLVPMLLAHSLFYIYTSMSTPASHRSQYQKY